VLARAAKLHLLDVGSTWMMMSQDHFWRESTAQHVAKPESN
jgi:hypothetical protein